VSRDAAMDKRNQAGQGIQANLIHRDGLNADILSDGTIFVGDRLLPDFSAERAH
jgi:hypothetical protein